MKVYYDKECDRAMLRGKRVAIVGYGSQGHAHALNLKDSGVDVIVGLRGPGSSWDQATQDGLRTLRVAEAAAEADVLMLLIPDEDQAECYRASLMEAMKPGATLAFAHGFNIHFGQIEPRNDLDVVMIAPKAPGRTVRSTYQAGGGTPSLIAVHQDVSGHAQATALAYAAAIGSGRAGIILTDFRVETETDLFGEQAVLCGGAVELIKCGFETLVEAGYPAELAYFECLHELKLIVDLLYRGGISGLNDGISNTAEFGEYVAGPAVVNENTKRTMRELLKTIQSGEFARNFIKDHQSGRPLLTERRKLDAAHPIEQVGARLRAMMPWINQN